MLSNAVVTQLAPPGTPDRTGDVTTPGTAAWVGRCPAYLRRVRTRVLASRGDVGDGSQRAQLTTVFRDMLVVQSPPQQLLAAVPGDDTGGWTILVEDRRPITPGTRRFRVVTVDHRAAGTRVDSLRLELDDEQAP